MSRAGLVGILTVSSTRHVAPLGGTRAGIGTNPIAFGFPRERARNLREGIVIDRKIFDALLALPDGRLRAALHEHNRRDDEPQ